MSTDAFQGGDKLTSLLQQYEANLKGQPSVSVGFFSGSTESKTLIPSAQAALLNEYGGTRSGTKKDGTAYTVTTPPRPFFRTMIRDGEKHWGNDLAKELKSTDMNASLSLNGLGTQMQEELIESAQLQRYTKLAQSTIDRKGNNTTLDDTGDMINAIAYQVDI
jgi:hypothetical protein